ncbi:MAG: hypothetical protein GY867_02985 [bacterium]|nr:hypothetical protein [bacterium]
MATSRSFIVLVLLLGLATFSCKGDIGTPQGGDIEATLDSLELKLNWLDHRLGQERWAKAIGGRADSLEFFEALSRAATSDEFVFNTLRSGGGRLGDEADRRRFDLVYGDVLHAYVNNSRNLNGTFDSLDSFHRLGKYEFNGEMLQREYLDVLVARSGNRSDRELAFRALNSPGETVTGQVGRLFRLRNQTAKRFGYNNYFALTESARKVGSSDYLTLVSRVDSVSRPEYQRLLGDLRDSFREPAFEIWDWGYSAAETWRELDPYFPADSQIRFLKRSLGEMGFDLDNSPIFFLNVGDSTSPGRAETIVVSAPHDIRVVCNLTDGLRSMQNLLRATGAALHTAETSQEPNLLGRKLESAWSAGIGRFFEDLCLQPDWLRTYARVPENLTIRAVRAKRAHELLKQRLLLTYAMFEYEAYRNPNTNLNTLWWDLFETYAMLPINEDLQPWAVSESFVHSPLGYRDSLQAEVIAAQTLAYLKGQYGGVVGNPEVRSFLVHNYFRFGGRYPWQELVERGTGEPPSPAYLPGE